MWGKIFLGALALLAAGAVAYVVVDGIITKRKLQEEMKKKNVKKALVQAVNRTNNVVKLKDLDSDDVLEIKSDDGIDSDIRVGDKIYV